MPPEQHVRSWALRDSNPRPSPCKSDGNMQVKGLTSANVVTSSPWTTSECLCLVMQEWCKLDRGVTTIRLAAAGVTRGPGY